MVSPSGGEFGAFPSGCGFAPMGGIAPWDAGAAESLVAEAVAIGLALSAEGIAPWPCAEPGEVLAAPMGGGVVVAAGAVAGGPRGESDPKAGGNPAVEDTAFPGTVAPGVAELAL